MRNNNYQWNYCQATSAVKIVVQCVPCVFLEFQSFCQIAVVVVEKLAFKRGICSESQDIKKITVHHPYYPFYINYIYFYVVHGRPSRSIT